MLSLEQSSLCLHRRSQNRCAKAWTNPHIWAWIKRVNDKNVRQDRLSFITDIDKAIEENEVIFIGVGTPTNGSSSISKNLNGYKVKVTRSTVSVGTNRWIQETIKENSGKK